MTGVAGLPGMGPEAITRLDRPGVPAGARTVPAGARVDPAGPVGVQEARADRRRLPVGTPNTRPAINRALLTSFGRARLCRVSQEKSTPSAA